MDGENAATRDPDGNARCVYFGIYGHRPKSWSERVSHRRNPQTSAKRPACRAAVAAADYFASSVATMAGGHVFANPVLLPDFYEGKSRQTKAVRSPEPEIQAEDDEAGSAVNFTVSAGKVNLTWI